MAQRRFSFLTFGSALAIGVALWTYVSLTRTYEDDLAVPFVVIAPPNQALLSTVPSTVTLRVRATGLQLVNAKYFSKSTACTLDLRKVRPAEGSRYIVEAADLLRTVVSSIPLRTVSVVPHRLELSTGDMFVKRVPLRVRHNVVCRPGFVLTSTPSADVQDVEVRGTKDIVERIRMWSTERIDLDDVHEPVSVTASMSDSLMSLVNVLPSTLRVTFNVQQEADRVIHDVPVRIASQDGTGRLTSAPQRISVVVRGGVDDVAAVTMNDLRAEITERPVSGYVRPRVHAPATVRVVSTTPPILHVVARTSNDESP